MARQFNGSNQYLQVESNPISAPPFTLACWFRADADGNDGCLLGIYDASAGNVGYSIEARGATAGDPVRARINVQYAVSTSAFTPGQWEHCCGVFASDTDRAVFLNGGSKGTNTSDQSLGGLDRVGVGRHADSTPSNYFDGGIAEIGIWDVALDEDTEIVALAAGIAPWKIRPQNLVWYVPCFGDGDPEPDLTPGQNSPAVTGATKAVSHAPVSWPRWSRVSSIFIPGGAAPSIVGDITVQTTIAATLDYTRNASIVGGITISSTVAATLDYTRNASIVGGITVSSTVAATLDYTRNAAIVGDISVSSSVAATLDYTRNADIVGDITVPLTIAATMAYTGSQPAIVGDITVPFTIAATLDYTKNADIVGDITVPFTVAATLEYTGAAAIVGDITISSTIAATMDYTRNAAIVGDITVPTTVAATLDYQQHPAIVGDITVSSTIAATLDHQQHPAITGDITVPFTVAATLDHTLNAAVIGDITVLFSVAAVMRHSSTVIPDRNLYIVTARDTDFLVPDRDTDYMARKE